MILELSCITNGIRAGFMDSMGHLLFQNAPVWGRTGQFCGYLHHRSRAECEVHRITEYSQLDHGVQLLLQDNPKNPTRMNIWVCKIPWNGKDQWHPRSETPNSTWRQKPKAKTGVISLNRQFLSLKWNSSRNVLLDYAGGHLSLSLAKLSLYLSCLMWLCFIPKESHPRTAHTFPWSLYQENFEKSWDSSTAGMIQTDPQIQCCDSPLGGFGTTEDFCTRAGKRSWISWIPGNYPHHWLCFPCFRKESRSQFLVSNQGKSPAYLIKKQIYKKKKDNAKGSLNSSAEDWDASLRSCLPPRKAQLVGASEVGGISVSLFEPNLHFCEFFAVLHRDQDPAKKREAPEKEKILSVLPRWSNHFWEGPWEQFLEQTHWYSLP